MFERVRMTFIPATMLGTDPSAIFHVGYVVEDLADAMAQLTESLGTRWVDHFVDVRYRSDSGVTIEARLHTSYSLDGPAHIELIEAVPNTVWELDSRSTLHHIGLWSDDIPAEASVLPARACRRLPPASDRAASQRTATSASTTTRPAGRSNSSMPASSTHSTNGSAASTQGTAMISSITFPSGSSQ